MNVDVTLPERLGGMARDTDLIEDRSRYASLKQAMMAIASVCDGAIERDNVGFNGPDAPLGRLLAFLPLEDWPPEALYQAWALLHKYQGQLAFHDIIYADLPEPPCLDAEHGTRFITLQDAGAFLVLFPSQAKLGAAFRRIPGGEKRTTPARHYLVQPVPGAGAALLAFAKRHGFQCAPGVAERARLIDYQVLLEENGMFGVYFPHDEDLNAEIKAIPGWGCVYKPHFRWLIPPRQVSAQGLHAFLTHHPKFLVCPEVEQRLQEASASYHILASVPARR